MSTNVPDLSGKKIGEYEIVARVGVGGMGAVYEGRQPLIGKRVAVKVLLPSLSNEKELVERFLAEARAVNEIRHRGIVDIFSFGQLPDGAHYFVMEFLEGEAFDKIIKKRSPLPLAEALGWADEMLDALDAAHSAGIIHRDIKPSNLFLVNTGRGRPYVKLLDFGIAKLGAIQGEATPQTRASVILGTPDYISPEQARGKPISPQTDLYALGCVLFEMVTGERVFRGENTLQTMWMHVEDRPPVPSTIRPDLPPELDNLILWALEKEPAARPPSAAAMREQIEYIRATFVPTAQLSPPPGGANAFRSSNTPPPSGRTPVVGGTPAPRSGSQAPLKTPSPASRSGQPSLKTPSPGSRSGGQASLSGRTRAAPPETLAAPDTRLAPLTAMTGASPAVEEEDVQQRVTDSTELPPKSKLPWILAAVVGVLVLAAIGFVVMPSSGEPSNEPSPVAVAEPLDARPPPDTKPVDAKPPPEDVKPPDVKPEATKPVEVKPEDAKPVEAKPEDAKPVEAKPTDTKPTDTKPADVKPKKVITAEQLAMRLKKIEGALAAREAETGQKDNVLRQFVEQARRQIQKASTEAERREAWSFLGDIESQLKR
ncbi:MAG: protein kinase domain-containing protein [Myxococcota bacterium]